MADYNLITPQFNENEAKEKIIIKEYELCFSNKKYSLTLSKSLSNELIFDICNKNISDIFYYKKKFSFEQLKKLNKCFVFYDSLENIIKFIEILLDENKVKLSYESGNLILVLSIFLPTGKKDEIKIFFDKQILNKDVIIEKLIDKINNLENSINTVIQNNQKKDEIIQLLEKRIHKLEEKEKERETSIKKSSIVLKNELNILLNEFQNHYIFKNKNIKFKLLYKASKDGHFINIFHNICDNKDKVIIFIKNNNGQRFGGYTRKGFSSENTEKEDDNAFVFSLDSKKIFPVIKGKQAIYWNKSFIGFKNTIYLRDDMFNNSFLSSGGTYNMEGYELSKSYSQTIITEIELYQIYYN